MKIDHSFPPNFDSITAEFPAVGRSTSAVFTYGETLHNPHHTEIRPDLMLHESVHERQQKNPDDWWKRYLSDPAFRLEQEVQAYAEQYHFLRSTLPNKKLKTALHYLALDLSSDGYGGIVDYSKAESLIRHAEHSLV